MGHYEERNENEIQVDKEEKSPENFNDNCQRL